MRLFFREHGSDLTFRCAMNASVRPALFPAVEIRLRFFQTLEAQPFERSSLGVAGAGFHFPFAIGILNPARQCQHTVVRQDISEQWIDAGIVEVGNRHSFFQVVENDESRATA